MSCCCAAVVIDVMMCIYLQLIYYVLDEVL